MTVSVTVKKRVIERDGGFCLMMLPGCSGEAQTTHAGAIVRADLIERGLRVEKAATNAATLHRSKATPVQAIDGEWYYLVSATVRRHVSEGRPEDGA
ncbi:hypothetical protein J2Y69_002257 [Microbacterium resistens]|uniref:Uncharacterized protein n=1 Tax=Microbacterium resistens TaxID=156977 RepID=A0ABU1SFC6_9MICO|nr:hypothetical protein [Microbacterium resistens]MDR6867653.1 hypothetical protein [Microbacterium resistens]